MVFAVAVTSQTTILKWSLFHMTTNFSSCNLTFFAQEKVTEGLQAWCQCYSPNNKLREFFAQFSEQKHYKPLIFNIVSIATSTKQVSWHCVCNNTHIIGRCKTNDKTSRLWLLQLAAQVLYGIHVEQNDKLSTPVELAATTGICVTVIHAVDCNSIWWTTIDDLPQNNVQ